MTFTKTKKVSLLTRIAIATIWRNSKGHTHSEEDVDGKIKLILHTFLGHIIYDNKSFWYVEEIQDK